jgi:hypothetical protein
VSLLCGVLLSTLLGGSAEAVRKRPGRVANNHQWSIGEPVSFENLTLFPVMSNRSTTAGAGFITLEQGLRAGAVKVRELRDRNGDDDAEVNRLMVTNRSGKTLILIAGEMLLGGKQDRIIANDCLVASSRRPVQVEVFCVERGRWDEESRFGRSSNVSAGPETIGGAASVAPPSAGVFASAGVIASNTVREKAQTEKDQSQVWAEVQRVEQVTVTGSPTHTLNAVYEDKKVKESITPYERAFRGKLTSRNIVGIVAAVSGKLVSADVFANHALFRAYWPKLLKSLSLEASNATTSEGAGPDKASAQAFLLQSEGEVAQSRKSSYRLLERQSDDEASFELITPAARAPVLVHFNKVKKN